MDALQAWLVVGIPTLVVTASMFVGRSPTRSAIGYFLLVPEDTGSAVVVGILGVLLLAVGRGGVVEQQAQHHETRRDLQHSETA